MRQAVEEVSFQRLLKITPQEIQDLEEHHFVLLFEAISDAKTNTLKPILPLVTDNLKQRKFKSNLAHVRQLRSYLALQEKNWLKIYHNRSLY